MQGPLDIPPLKTNILIGTGTDRRSAGALFDFDGFGIPAYNGHAVWLETGEPLAGWGTLSGDSYAVLGDTADGPLFLGNVNKSAVDEFAAKHPDARFFMPLAS